MASFSSFKMDRQVFEARFPQNYTFWDRSGEFWTALSRTFSDLKLVMADPNHTQFEAGELYLVAEAGLLRITAKETIPPEEFREKCVIFADSAIDIFGIELFDRLGFRVIWTQDFDSMSGAADAFREFGIVAELDGSAFAIPEKPSLLEAKLTWEDNHVGVMLGLRTEKRRVDPQIPWDVRSQMRATSDERCLLVIDVDKYTKSILRRDQIDVSEWISSANRLVKKGISKELFK